MATSTSPTPVRSPTVLPPELAPQRPGAGGRGDPHADIGHRYHVRAPAEALPVQPAALEQAIQMTMEVSTPATDSSARRRTPDTSHLEGQAGYG